MIPVTVQTPFSPGPIASAGAVPLEDSVGGQPVMGETLLDWFRPIVVGTITTAIDEGGAAKETVREVRTSGCFQAGEGEKLDVQAGGERSWQTGLLHTTPDFNVPTDTLLRIRGVRYRIMKKGDYSVNGFVRYELLETYARAR